MYKRYGILIHSTPTAQNSAPDQYSIHGIGDNRLTCSYRQDIYPTHDKATQSISSYSLEKYGYKTEAGAKRALKSDMNWIESNNAHGNWYTTAEIVEFTIQHSD